MLTIEEQADLFGMQKEGKSYAAELLGRDGFDDITPDDVNDLIDAHSQPLTDEDLTEMRRSASEEKEQEELEAEEEEVEPSSTASQL
ncbi:unnamed protein product [Soboliphyme baturini]|uniref:RNA polymerase sigma factor RpoD n=1 Tax=Soboliphyme baturini TaxID=241478 RepID=A0A183IW99_9BILA|nr:unnamed protein product [Soboliphyme baturini]